MADNWNGNTPGYSEILSPLEVKNRPDEPVVDSRHVRGGGLSVETLADLAGIPKSVLKKGVTVVYVAETGKRYEPVTIPATANPVVWAVVDAGGHIQHTDTGTDKQVFSIGDAQTPGAVRTLAANGLLANVDLLLAGKGAGKLKFAGVAANRIASTDAAGGVVGEFETADEFTAVPPLFTSPGIPGQKAWSSPFLYYCIALDTWVRFLSESGTITFAEMFTGVPPTLASAGIMGQWSYDPASELLFFCVSTNVWVHFPAFPQTYASLYVAVPPTPTSTGLQGQRAYDSAGGLMYECVANNVWVRYAVVSAW